VDRSASRVGAAAGTGGMARPCARGAGTTNRAYPFLAYGTDWLAFAHLVLAVLFVGVWVDPLRNKWVVQFGLIACSGVLLLALIAWPVRGIPFYWRMIDCSFGVFGAVPLMICLRDIKKLEAVGQSEAALSRPQE